MHIHSSNCLPASRRLPVRRSGFALIATISLLVLIAMISMALIQLATVNTRAARLEVSKDEARAQARLALENAIGQLQLELGPDQRISANSGVLEKAANPHILGVWHSWDNWLNAQHSELGIEIKGTYDAGRKAAFRRWLISDSNLANITDVNAASSGNLGTEGDDKIILIGEGSLGQSSDRNKHVYAGKFRMPDIKRSKQVGNPVYGAWWIGGENQKVKINTLNDEATQSNLLARSWNTPSPEIKDLKSNDYDLSGLDDSNEQKQRLQSFDTIGLAAGNKEKSNAGYFHDVTTFSEGLLSDVRNGGLKKDLNLMLNQQSLPEELRPTNSAHIALRPMSYDLRAYSPKFTDRPIGSWTHLQEWARVNNRDQIGSGQDETSRLANSSGSVYTYPAIDKEGSGSSGLNFGKEPSNDRYVYYRDPVLLKFYQVFGMVTYKQSDTRWNCDLSYSPTFVWWNPYNVEMRVPSDKLAAHSLVYKTGLLQIRAWNKGLIDRSASQKKYDAEGFSTYEFIQSNDPLYAYGNDWGNPFRRSVTGGDIIFKPGEILIFSHHEDRSADTKINHPFAEGYRPEAVARHRVRLFSKKTLQEIQEHEYDMRFNSSPTYGSGEDWTWGGGNPGAFTMWLGHGCFEDASSNGSGMYAKIPANYLIDWNQKGQMIVNKAKFNTGMTMENPYLIALTGWSIKSNTEGLSDGDYRTKSWAHSSPTLWGGNLFNPTKQVKTYHPVEMIWREVNGLNLGEIVPHIGRNAFFGGTGGEVVSCIPALELPLQQPYGLAGFSGYRIFPGWFDASKTFGENLSLSISRRFAYMSGVPGVGIGNSFADPMIPGEKVYQQHNISAIKNPTNNKASGFLDDFWDYGLLINDSLWDSWFTSSLAGAADKAGEQSFISNEQGIKNFFDAGKPLANFRFKANLNGQSSKDVISELGDQTKGYQKVARYLTVDGAFNVNSTSVAAWTAILKSLKQRQVLYQKGSKLSPVDARGGAAFSRHSVATADRSNDDPLSGTDVDGLTSWSSLIILEDRQLEDLAEKIVEQVKLRGPFLNMSDFVNRRLAGDATGLMGALQAAIQEAGINRSFDSYSAPNSGVFPNSKAEQGSLYQGALGYMVQSDLLAGLSNTLQVRDDTFKIRAYGEVRSPDNKKVMAKAWCEAVVQRVVDYTDVSNNPETPALIDLQYTGDYKRNDQLSEINRSLGRKFKIISFKWLTPEEI